MAEAPQDAQDEPKQNGAIEVTSEAEQVVDKINGTNAILNGTTTHDKHYRSSDPDAQDMVISSLRSQIQDLFSQVTQLNAKLVKSYDRVSDLEDDIHMASATARSSSLKISQLELERTQHLSALNTGLLVEKSHVTAELTRLMEKATEEAAQRGQAETARQDIEKDLDDLSATLFGQANTMVAEARYAKYLSEQKLADAELALKGAEEAVGVMQQQMQALHAEKEEAEQKAEEALVAMGKGKHKERSGSTDLTRPIRLLSSHLPYQEFLLFVAHLRSIHPSSPQPPAMATLLPLPFLARLLTEDSEPTVRLDLAPSLNWLSRRSVLSAIHNGQLIIEPMSTSALLQEFSTPGLSNNISCALCGTPIFSVQINHTHSRPQPPLLGHSNSNSNSMSWSASLFKKPSQSNNSQPPTPTSQQTLPPQVYIFRLALPASTTSTILVPPISRTTISGLPSSSSQLTDHTPYTSSPTPQSSTIYPLCTNNWCLSRLRTTCTLWAFVRTGVVEKIWDEEVPTLVPATIAASPTGEKPPIPPRRRGIWSTVSALSERATSWGEGDKDKAKRVVQVPPPPPERQSAERRRLPPPLPPVQPETPAPTPAKQSAPPPLPKRSEVRHQPPLETAPAQGSAAKLKDSALPPRPPRRPMTPANVPLPESRPHTPVFANAAPPSAVPAVAGATISGSPVPPPLPRRAAARAPRLPADGGSRPATPAANAEPTEPIAESKTDDHAADTSSKAEAELTVSPTADEAKTGQETSSEATEEKARVDVTPPGGMSDDEKEVFVDAEAALAPQAATSDEAGDKEVAAEVNGTPVEKEGKKENEVADAGELVVDEAKDSTVPSEDVTSQVHEETKGVESNEKIQEKETAAPELKVLTTPDRVEESAVAAKDENPDADSEMKPDDAKEAYIGDATWEERTWKEIVRLKEEMFWARIGGLRQ